MLIFAQDNPEDSMQIIRETYQGKKKVFIATYLPLSKTEGKAFWPLYDQYQKDLVVLGDSRIKLIKDYVKNYLTMSNRDATKLLDEYIASENERIKLMKAWLPKFLKVLPAKKVIRYYQLENKIHAVVMYELANEIPLSKAEEN
jgi:hypothetical protein